jgi:hypothetical protein
MSIRGPEVAPAVAALSNKVVEATTEKAIRFIGALLGCEDLGSHRLIVMRGVATALCVQAKHAKHGSIKIEFRPTLRRE